MTVFVITTALLLKYKNENYKLLITTLWNVGRLDDDDAPLRMMKVLHSMIHEAI